MTGFGTPIAAAILLKCFGLKKISYVTVPQPLFILIFKVHQHLRLLSDRLAARYLRVHDSEHLDTAFASWLRCSALLHNDLEVLQSVSLKHLIFRLLTSLTSDAHKYSIIGLVVGA